MAMLSFFETGKACALSPKLLPRVRAAYTELLSNEGRGSARVVASFLKHFRKGKINVTNFGIGSGTIAGIYATDGVQMPGAGYDGVVLSQSAVDLQWYQRPEDLPLDVRVNLLNSVLADARRSVGSVDKVHKELGLHPSQTGQLVCG